MSQDDQRNQPNEEPAAGTPAAGGPAAGVPAAGGPGAGARAAETQVGPAVGASGPVGAAEAVRAAGTAGTAEAAEAAAGPAAAPHAPPLTPRREFHDPGDGAARYADTVAEMPRSGSEQSWSAEPNPGYQRDPRIHYPTKRVVAGALVGALVLAAGVVYGARLLTNRSGNGFGPAPWTAAVSQHGAVVGGINAQNNNSAPELNLPAGLTYGTSGTANAALIASAITSCRTATALTLPVTTEVGTSAAISDWAVHASPNVEALHNNAAVLSRALTQGHVAAVASAANTLCLGYPTIAHLPLMPDAAGSKAWSIAVSSYATAATESLRGVSGNPDATAAAFDNIAQGDQQLTVLSQRIISATAP
jgi:hypothetical protein